MLENSDENRRGGAAIWSKFRASTKLDSIIGSHRSVKTSQLMKSTLQISGHGRKFDRNRIPIRNRIIFGRNQITKSITKEDAGRLYGNKTSKMFQRPTQTSNQTTNSIDPSPSLNMSDEQLAIGISESRIGKRNTVSSVEGQNETGADNGNIGLTRQVPVKSRRRRQVWRMSAFPIDLRNDIKCEQLDSTGAKYCWIKEKDNPDRIIILDGRGQSTEEIKAEQERDKMRIVQLGKRYASLMQIFAAYKERERQRLMTLQRLESQANELLKRKDEMLEALWKRQMEVRELMEPENMNRKLRMMKLRISTALKKKDMAAMGKRKLVMLRKRRK